MNPEYPYQPQPQQPQPSAPGPVPGQMYTMPGQQPPAPMQPQYSPIGPPNLPKPRRNPAKKWIIMTFVFIFTTLAAGGVAVWAYMNYLDQKNNVDSKISSAVAIAVKESEDKAAAEFLEKEKQPNRQFVGPDDYGRVSFDYPKTWSVYEAKDAVSGGTYEAYFNPGVVPAVASDQQYALHVTIEEKDYDKELTSYDSLVKRGDLKSSSFKVDDAVNGTRLDGSFTKDIRGFALVFKIRDKTVTIRSDAEVFKGDFDALIQTITFNQ